MTLPTSRLGVRVSLSAPLKIMEDNNMSIAFMIDTNLDIILSSWIGKISDEVLITTFNHMLKTNKDFHPGLHHIADICEADTTEISKSALKELSEIMKRHTYRGNRYVAIIAEQESDFKMSEIYRSFFKQEDRDIEIFTNFEDALEWIKHVRKD